MLKKAATMLRQSALLHPVNSKSRVSQMKVAGKQFELAGMIDSAINCLKETGNVVEASILREEQGNYVVAAGLLGGKNKFEHQLALAYRYN